MIGLAARPDFWSRPRSSPESIRQYQDSRIRHLVTHAWDNVPFYRRRFEAAGVHPRDIRGAADLTSIPVLHKSDLRESFDDFLARGTDLASCNMHNSSGTTGEPVRIVRTRREEHALLAVRLRAQVLSGLRPWDLRMKIGSPPALAWPHRIGLFRCTSVSELEPPAFILSRLKNQRPSVIYSAPGILGMLLTPAGEVRLRALCPRLIFTGGELLSRQMRAKLQEVFGCPVVDFYGAVEFNLIAWECRSCGLYHTCDDSVLVEVLKDDGSPAGPGEQGRLVATALHSVAFPLLRYEVGDVVRKPLRAPSCAIRFASIDRILGRMADYLLLPNGHRLSPHRLEEVTDDVPGLRRFQFVQTGPSEILFRIQPGKEFTGDSLHLLRRNLAALLPPGLRVEIRAVEEIALTPAGKHKVVQAWRDSGTEAPVPPAGEDR